MSTYKTLDDFAPKGKRVLLRVDLNVPMRDGKVSDATRIERLAPTISELADKGAVVIVASHFGRPKGERNPDMSLAALAGPLSDALGGRRVFRASQGQQAEAQLQPGVHGVARVVPLLGLFVNDAGVVIVEVLDGMESSSSK